jgi:hypothetical protein
VFQGFRGRPVGRWLAIATLPAYALMFHDRHQWNCESRAASVGSLIEFAAVTLMCLHHIIQRPSVKPA